MNTKLQQLLESVRNSTQFTDEEKAAFAKTATELDKEIEITTFKLERTEKVKRTTAILLEETIEELEQKRKAVETQNKELEIESSLERVRTVAMGMIKRDDMLDICRIISEQLELLQVKDIRNVQTAIFDEAKHIYLNYEYYGKYDKTFITEVDYTVHPVQSAFAQQMLKGKGSFFSTSLEGKKLDEFIEHQKAGPEFVDPFLFEAPSLTWYWASLGPIAFGVSTYSPLNEDNQEVVKRFRNVFDLSYRRYLDIEKAAAQAKEAQIEAALEKVRSRSMGMQKSAALTEVIQIVYRQLRHLKVNLAHAGFVVDYTPGGDWHFWIADEQDIPSKITHPWFESVWANQFNEAKEKGADFFTTRLNFEEKNRFYTELLSYVPGLPEASKDFYLSCPGLAASTVLFENVSLYIENFEGTPYSDEDNAILMRFGKVFQQTYTRFLDLQKAEAQAREAQIQLGLERARAQSMMMQHSTELDDTLRVFHEQVLFLNIPSAFSFLWLPDEQKDRHIFWAAWAENLPAGQAGNATVFRSKAIDYPLDRNEPATAQCLIDWKGTEPVVAYHVPPDGVKNYFAAWSELIAGIEQLKPEYFNDGLYYVEAFMKYGCFGVIVKNTLAEDEKKILERFATEFERTYTRFLDLQKAEAQAREAQIEIALERVRSRAMAMHSSDELKALIGTVFTELTKLDLALTRCIIWVFEQHSNAARWWMANGEDPLNPMSFYLKYHEHPAYLKFLTEWKNQNVKFVYDLKGQDKINWDDILFNETELKNLPEVVKDGMRSPERVLLSASFNNFGGINVASLEPLSGEHFDILLRFAKVFDLTYTRFLDLQKAEAQTREAKIEAALEKVRSRTMAMQRSEELSLTVKVIFEEFKSLQTEGDITNNNRGFITTINEEKKYFELWITEIDGTEINKQFYIEFDEPTTGRSLYDAWLNKMPALIVDLQGEELDRWLNYLIATGFKIAPGILGTRRINNFLYYSKGFIGITSSSPLSENNLLLLQRFAAVFDGTYTRFLDLQKAEAQAREAQIETALEKVRSRTLAMQKSDELAETAAELFRQLIGLGIEPNRLYIGIVNAHTRDMEMWATDEDGTSVGKKFSFNANDNASVGKLYDGWIKKKKSVSVDMRGKELKTYIDYLQQLHIPVSHALTQERRVQSVAYFDKGFIGMASPDEQSGQSIQLLERFAAVFNLTFTRFNDLQIAEAHAAQAELDLIAIKEAKQKAEEALGELQATQKQLIQSEKMASLGELTAGIAHEIQNPLNFVNNFSEVSKELLDEMKEAIDKGDTEEAKEIMNDVIQNLEKINHHGKRADGIVKGMLQHSRAGSGQKEPTDINALCDEYLRLSYHGLRAKDKSFNATIKTDLDPAIGKINIISQDIGRVILNLLTNAFYVVNEKKGLRQAQGDSLYEPTVTVTTRRLGPPLGDGGKVEIRVTDNGTGIPQKVLDKIFQPFFTTKPTGQGTGLGLSLSYDIISKGHAGELKVETKEMEGSVFIIQLPTN